jgi:hypothetical protein
VLETLGEGMALRLPEGGGALPHPSLDSLEVSDLARAAGDGLQLEVCRARTPGGT